MERSDLKAGYDGHLDSAYYSIEITAAFYSHHPLQLNNADPEFRPSVDGVSALRAGRSLTKRRSGSRLPNDRPERPAGRSD